MNHLIKAITPETLQSWGVSSNAQIEYYDGKLLVIDDSIEEGGIGTMAKFGFSLIFGVAVFTHAPLVGATMFAYSAYKVLSTVGSMYGGNNNLAAKVKRDLGLDAAALPDATDALPVATSSPIGNTTKFGAIDVPASPVAQTSGVAWQTPDSYSTPQTPIISKLREVCDRNLSFYIAGSKGSGKGIFASNLLRWKLDQYPNAIALVLDPKGDVKEAGYWQHERIRHFAFKGIALSSEQYAEKVIEFLSEARNLVSQADVTRGMRLFLVLDELLTLKETLSNGLFAEFRRFGVSAISTGDSEGIHLIAITQSFNAGDSFGSDELLKNFTQVGLFREDEYTRAKKLIQFGRSNGELTEAEFKALIRASEKDRVMSIAGEFIPTPELENHSSFDRDSGKVIKQMPLGVSPSEGDQLAHELSQKVQLMAIAKPKAPDVFSSFADELSHKSQADLNSFVQWLAGRKGTEITFDQIKDSWARRANVSRSKEAIMPLIYAAKSKKLITLLANRNWLVSNG